MRTPSSEQVCRPIYREGRELLSVAWLLFGCASRSVEFEPDDLRAPLQPADGVRPEIPLARRVIERDWKHSRPIDLSDEGLARDLKKYGPKVFHELALTQSTDPEVKSKKNGKPKHKGTKKQKRH